MRLGDSVKIPPMSGVGTAVIGCGNISGIYLENLLFFEGINLLGCADLDPARAQAQAAKYGTRAYDSVASLLADPAVEIVVNLTTPDQHVPVCEQVIEASKHVYIEKPLALDPAGARRLLQLAGQKGVQIACAPDTVLGAGIQTCRYLVDTGAIGDVTSFQGFMLCPGHESWHPDPGFYYQPGGGPMFDMGPYYLTALVTLLGPVRRVSGVARRTHAQRTITSEPRAGEIIDVNVETHVVAVLEFASGPVGQLTTSFDALPADLPPILLFGTEGNLSVPDPNTFGGPVLLRRRREEQWTEMELSFPHHTNRRGLGVADLADSIQSGRNTRLSGKLGTHIVDIMAAVHTASATGRYVELETSIDRPDQMPSLSYV